MIESDIPELALIGRGKVRDLYDLGDEMLIVTTDRLSAFDVVFAEGIPDKGRVLTALSCFWFELASEVVSHHLISTDLAAMPAPVQAQGDELGGRVMLCRKAEVLPVECIVRGYIVGSGYKDYLRTGTVCGIRLPAGLRAGDRFDDPIFTPSTKATTGHDENISFARMEKTVGSERAAQIRDTSLELYRRAAEHAARKGILIADTKFEFGLIDDELTLIDEALTPDSSRFWDAAAWAPGSVPAAFDKQVVRDYLETLDWNKQPPPPLLPPEIVAETAARYRTILARLTGLPGGARQNGGAS